MPIHPAALYLDAKTGELTAKGVSLELAAVAFRGKKWPPYVAAVTANMD